MVQYVTERDPQRNPDDTKIMHSARWGRRLQAHSHVLIKVLGDTISASWSVTNTGDISGVGGLDILIIGPNVGYIGPNVSIPAGATATLAVSGVLASPLTPGSYTGQLRLTAVAPATVAPGNVHNFSITITVPVVTHTEAEVIAAAQELAAGVPFPDQRFFVGMALVNFNMMKIIAACNPNDQPFSAAGWQAELNFWKASGCIKEGTLVA